jgi:hypothetical protein
MLALTSDDGAFRRGACVGLGSRRRSAFIIAICGSIVSPRAFDRDYRSGSGQ